MAKCKDCLHMELCARDERLTEFSPEQEALCQMFIDRNRYVVREKGEWLMNRDGSCTCKRCRRTTKDAWDFDSWMNFCPNCGADMRFADWLKQPVKDGEGDG